MEDLKKTLFDDFSNHLRNIKATNKIACIVDDVYAELIELPTDVPFNVLDEDVKQNTTMYTLDISGVDSTRKTIQVKGSKIQIYFSKKDIMETSTEFFEPFIEIHDIEDVYKIYEELEDIKEEKLVDETDESINDFFEDYNDDDEDFYSDEDYSSDEDKKIIDNFLKNE